MKKMIVSDFRQILIMEPRTHNKTTPIKRTPSKSMRKKSDVNLTSEKYLNAKLDFTERKKISMERVIELKNARIRELENQIKDNQCLVTQTLEKWREYRSDVDRGGKQEIMEMEEQIERLRNKFEGLEAEVERKQEENKSLRAKNSSLEREKSEIEKKYEKLTKKYKQDRKEWKQTCLYINELMDFIKSLPPEILQTQPRLPL